MRTTRVVISTLLTLVAVSTLVTRSWIHSPNGRRCAVAESLVSSVALCPESVSRLAFVGTSLVLSPSSPEEFTLES